MCLSAAGRRDRPALHTIRHFGRPKQSSRRLPWPPGPGPRLTTGLGGATATRLRFEESRNIPDLVSNCRSVDSPEGAADVQLALPLEHFHAAPADGGVYMFIDPRPW